MKFKIVLPLLLLGMATTSLQGQSALPIAKEFSTAYANGTRSFDGKPGVNYWQNKSDYDLEATLDPENSWLYGKGKIKYTNNSPDTLNQVVIRLYQNLYKKGSQKDYPITEVDVHDGVIISKFKKDGQTIELGDSKTVRQSGTILELKLDKPLAPGFSTLFEIDWSFHIPEKWQLRMGKGDESSWFVAYWYPQIAVYDDVIGWDKLGYHGLGEFYLDVASFKVSLKAPNTFGIWAGAELDNIEEVYEPSFVSKLTKAYASDETINLITAMDIKNKKMPYSKKKDSIVWRFSADQSPDFAFTFGDHYLWDASGISLKNGKRIKINAVYRENAKDFHEVAMMNRLAVDYFSNELPGVDFPYPIMTVVHGANDNTSGGMEFPMICNNPTSKNRGRTADVTTHEMAHIYFPFYVLTNERRHAWMDEGWAAMLPAAYMKRVAPSSNRLTRYSDELTKYVFGSMDDLPIFTPSYSLSLYNYFGASYSKPALAYYYLQQELGEDLFKASLKEYIERWAFKHPTPYDFFFTFNDASKKNLDWFWQSWFLEKGIPDLALEKVEKHGSGHAVIIANKGGLPLPVHVRFTYVNGESEEVVKTIGVWQHGAEKIRIISKLPLAKVVLGSPYVPDMDTANNTLIPKD